MYEAGRCANTAKKMKEYQLEILGICETRWTDVEKTTLKTGETIIYSGNKGQTAHHTIGVGIMMTQRAAISLLGWETVNERISRSRFRTSNCRVTLSVITCYAPTNETDEEVKEEFYELLQNIMNHEQKIKERGCTSDR
jgi:exonuclease III